VLLPSLYLLYLWQAGASSVADPLEQNENHSFHVNFQAALQKLHWIMCASGTIPVKLLLQLATVFKPGGLQNRKGTISYMNRLKNCKVPVLAIAGDGDLICPPVAVTGKYLHSNLVLVYFRALMQKSGYSLFVLRAGSQLRC